jgi:serine/threonine protein kinase
MNGYPCRKRLVEDGIALKNFGRGERQSWRGPTVLERATPSSLSVRRSSPRRFTFTCTIHDVGRHGELDYLVLEYLEGETLEERLRRPAEPSIDEALAIAIQIGDALDRAHHAGIVHRDLKPANVMLVRRGGPSSSPEVKLLDFGLAARPPALNASLEATRAPSLVATRPPAPVAASSLSGTVPYMAPEQLDGDAGDHRVDIFAFGCVLYEMLARRKAFEGTSAFTVIAAIMSGEPPPIAALQSAHPLLDHVVRRCIEKDRERRWQNIRDVTGELRWNDLFGIQLNGAPFVSTCESHNGTVIGGSFFTDPSIE